MISASYVRTTLNTTKGAETATALCNALESAGWEYTGAKQQSGAMVWRSGFYFQTAEPPPDPIDDGDKGLPGVYPIWRQTSFAEGMYVAYDPFRTIAVEGMDVGGTPVYYYQAKLTTLLSAEAMADKMTEKSPFSVSHPTEGTDGNYYFTVGQNSSTIMFENDDKPIGMAGPSHTFGGWREMKSQPIQYEEDGNDVTEGGSIYIRIGTYFYVTFGGITRSETGLGALGCFVQVRAENSSDWYSHFLLAGEKTFIGNRHQFVVFGSALASNLLVSALKSDSKHRTGAAPVLIVGSSNADGSAPYNQITTKLYWDQAMGCGMLTTMSPTVFHGGTMNSTYPVLMVRGIRGRPMLSRSGEPLQQAPYVVLGPDGPYGASQGVLAGKLWDMIVLSGPPTANIANPGAVPMIKFAGRKWEKLATNTTSGWDIGCTLWIRAEE